MRKLGLLIFVLAAYSTQPAFASQKWLASNGSGNACTRSAPCFEMFGNIVTGDTFYCVDNIDGLGLTFLPGYYISVVCDGAKMYLPFLTFASVPQTADITFQGMVFDCGPNTTASGLTVYGAGTVHVRDVTVRNCLNGINFVPTGGTAKLIVSDSFFDHNSNAGINVVTSAGAAAAVALENVSSSSNAIGLNFSGGGKVTVRNSDFSQNGTGVVAKGVIDFRDSSSSGNNIGISAAGNLGKITLSNSRVFGNVSGLVKSGAAVIQSFGNNEIYGNTADGAFSSGPLPLK